MPGMLGGVKLGNTLLTSDQGNFNQVTTRSHNRTQVTVVGYMCPPQCHQLTVFWASYGQKVTNLVDLVSNLRDLWSCCRWSEVSYWSFSFYSWVPSARYKKWMMRILLITLSSLVHHYQQRLVKIGLWNTQSDTKILNTSGSEISPDMSTIRRSASCPLVMHLGWEDLLSRSCWTLIWRVDTCCCGNQCKRECLKFPLDKIQVFVCGPEWKL